MANFIKVNEVEELDLLLNTSDDAPVVLFKHSLTCPISHGVYEEVSRFEGDVNLVVVQTARPVSNGIESRTGIRHESPQALVVKNGAVVYHASHYDVTAADIAKAVSGE